MKLQSTRARRVLAALACSGERTSLSQILAGTAWEVRFARDLGDTKAALRDLNPGIVICGERLEDGHDWKDVLREIQELPGTLPLIVADRLADDALWAEVLNLGAYDLLMTPFQSEEVCRVLGMAWDSSCGAAGPKGMSAQRARYPAHSSEKARAALVG